VTSPSEAPPSATNRPAAASRTIALSVVGAVSAVVGGKLLGRASNVALMAAAAIAIGIVVLMFRRRRRFSGRAEPLGQVIVIAVVGAVAGAGGERLYDRAPGILLAIGVASLIGLLIAWRRHRSRAA